MTREQLEESISRPSEGSIFEEGPTSEVKYFNHQGEEDHLDESRAAAKIVKVDRHQKYYVKSKNSGEFYDPKKHLLGQKDQYMKSHKFSFIKVTESGFNSYLRFLQKGHKSLLTAAQREIQNG